MHAETQEGRASPVSLPEDRMWRSVRHGRKRDDPVLAPAGQFQRHMPGAAEPIHGQKDGGPSDAWKLSDQFVEARGTVCAQYLKNLLIHMTPVWRKYL